MNLNFRRTALLVGICSAVSLTYTPQLFAASVDAIDAVQQAKKITGTVTDAMGPVIGANVLEKGTTNGVITDIDGNFTLNVQPGATIVVSFIGYQPQEIVVGNQTSFKIQLKEDTELLDEVVVVGYGVQKKKLVTGATVEVKGEDIAKLNTTQALGYFLYLYKSVYYIFYLLYFAKAQCRRMVLLFLTTKPNMENL